MCSIDDPPIFGNLPIWIDLGSSKRIMAAFGRRGLRLVVVVVVVVVVARRSVAPSVPLGIENIFVQTPRFRVFCGSLTLWMLPTIISEVNSKCREINYPRMHPARECCPI